MESALVITLSNEQIKKKYIYTVEYYLAMMKNEITYSFCRKIDGTGDYHIELNKPHLDKYHIFSLIC
jgi:hypothetical protein